MSFKLARYTAEDLLRTALLAKLAVDLEDPVLARRASKAAAGHARLLSGLGFPAYVDEQGRQDDLPPEVEEGRRAWGEKGRLPGGLPFCRCGGTGAGGSSEPDRHLADLPSGPAHHGLQGDTPHASGRHG